MAKPMVARAPAVFCTVPEMQGLITEPPMPMRRMATTTATTRSVPAVNSEPTVALSSAPPNQTG